MLLPPWAFNSHKEIAIACLACLCLFTSLLLITHLIRVKVSVSLAYIGKAWQSKH